MALEDITSDVEEETKEEESEELKDELGIEDRETLKEVDGRLDDIMELAINLDRRVQDLEDDLQINRGAILALLREIGNPEDAEVEQLAEEEESKNPWLAGDD